MPNIKRLTEYYELLCDELNKNGYKLRGRTAERSFESDFKPDYDNLDLTIMYITDDYKTYDYLNNRGLINHDLCHFCGDFLGSDKLYFTEPTHNIKIEICRSCNTKGKIQQTIYKDMLKPKSGCLFLVLVLLIIFLCILIIPKTLYD